MTMDLLYYKMLCGLEFFAVAFRSLKVTANVLENIDWERYVALYPYGEKQDRVMHGR